MEKIKLAQASHLTSPNPVTVVCTEKPDGSTNLATVSWWTYLSFNPNMIAFAMAKTSYSGERVRETGKFGIELASVEGSKIQIPAHSRVAIQCHMKEYHETGDHYLYICDVEQVYGNEAEEALFAWNGYSQLRPAK